MPLNKQGYKHIESVTHLNPRTIFIAILLFIGGVYWFMLFLSQPNLHNGALSLVLIASGFPFLLYVERIAVCGERKAIAIYKYYLFFRIRREILADQYQCIVVFFESSSSPEFDMQEVFKRVHRTQSRHYEVYLIGPKQKKCFIREYDQYKPAKKLCETLSAELKLNHEPQLIIGKSPERYVCKGEG